MSTAVVNIRGNSTRSRKVRRERLASVSAWD